MACLLPYDMRETRADRISCAFGDSFGHGLWHCLRCLASLPTNDDYRRMLGQPDLTDEEVDVFRADLRSFANRFLDDYFREEFQSDEEWFAGTRTPQEGT